MHVWGKAGVEAGVGERVEARFGAGVEPALEAGVVGPVM